MKLNVGCGCDYRAGFINIDAANNLPKVDLNMRIDAQSLFGSFRKQSINFILANDVLEHYPHWEAVSLLKAFYDLLECGGTLQVRVPDCARIISHDGISLSRKLVLLFGGQDVSQGRNSVMELSRQENPDLFCHRYGWTLTSLRSEFETAGFSRIRSHALRTNCVVVGTKE